MKDLIVRPIQRIPRYELLIQVCMKMPDFLKVVILFLVGVIINDK